MSIFIHHLADVESPENIGDGTKIWRWTHISKGVKIGMNCMIGANCYIGPDVEIGDNVRIQNGSFIPSGVTLKKNVFIGPNVVFTNDKYPPSSSLEKTLVCDGVSIGANSTILPGLTIYGGTIIGAGSVLTKSTLAHETWVGNPARETRYLEG